MSKSKKKEVGSCGEIHSFFLTQLCWKILEIFKKSCKFSAFFVHFFGKFWNFSKKSGAAAAKLLENSGKAHKKLQNLTKSCPKKLENFQFLEKIHKIQQAAQHFFQKNLTKVQVWARDFLCIFQ